jgi:hypothetical protein
MTAAAIPAGATVKPKLSGGQRVTAALAGILGFLLHSIGWALIVVALALGSIVNFIAVAIRNTGSSTSSEAAARVFRQLSNAVNIGIAPLVIAGVIGAVLWVLALFISRGILRRGGHHRPWAVTWAGLGIAVLMSWVLGAIGAVVVWIVVQVQIAQATRGLANGSVPKVRQALQPLVDTATVSAIAWLVLAAVIGWIAWSWMAHALRPTVDQIADRDARDQKRIDAERQRIASDTDRHEEEGARARVEEQDRQLAESERAQREAAAQPAETATTTAETPPADDRGPRP